MLAAQTKSEESKALLNSCSPGQAMHRFRLLPKLGEMLRKKGVQAQFLQLSGCTILEKWLS